MLTAASIQAQAKSDTALTIVNGPIGQRADSTLTALQAKGFSGVALVASRGQIVLKKGYGLANRANNMPIVANSIVQIGSNTKDFTIVAMLQLQERGKLSLDDNITKFFKNVPTDKRGVTLNQLLHHQAGFDQHLGGDWDVISRDEEIDKALASKLLFVPGTDRQYSNVGFSLLAAVIELVSGVSYDVYVRDNILKPIGLTETGYLLPKFAPARVVRGYRDGKDQGTFLERAHPPDGVYWNLRGNGGMLSTVSDMFRFYRALYSDGPLLEPASRNLFFRPDEPVVLAGSDLTFFFFYSRYPGIGLDVMLSTNSNDFPATQVRQALDVAAGAPLPQPGRGGMQTSIDTGPPGGGRGRVGRGGTSSGAAVSIPDTPAGRGLRKYLDTYRGLDSTVMRRFFEQDVAKSTRTTDERIATMKGMRGDMGDLTPIQVVTSTGQQIQVVFRAASGGEATITVTVEPTAPFRIVTFQVER
ncbi:MAG: serine hydrolase domain-containing protein [Gemmatimonas sp.]